MFTDHLCSLYILWKYCRLPPPPKSLNWFYNSLVEVFSFPNFLEILVNNSKHLSLDLRSSSLGYSKSFLFHFPILVSRTKLHSCMQFQSPEQVHPSHSSKSPSTNRTFETHLRYPHYSPSPFSPPLNLKESWASKTQSSSRWSRDSICRSTWEIEGIFHANHGQAAFDGHTYQGARLFRWR